MIKRNVIKMNLLQITVLTILIYVINALPHQNFDNNLRVKIIRMHSSEEISEELSKKGPSCGYNVSVCRCNRFLEWNLKLLFL